MPYLRDLTDTTSWGASLDNMLRAAHALGFDASCGRGQVASLTKLPLPAIAHFDGRATGHYVVIYEARDKWVTIADPSDGLVTLSRPEFERRWSGALLLLRPNASFSIQRRDDTFFSQSWQLLLPHKYIIALAIACGLAFVASSFTIALLLRALLNKIIPHSDRITLTLAALVATCGVAVRAGTFLARGVVTRNIGRRIEHDLAGEFLESLLFQSLNSINRATSGELYMRLQDAVRVKFAVASHLLSKVVDVVLLCGSLIGLIIINPGLAWLPAAYSISICLLVFFSYRESIRLEWNSRLQAGNFASAFLDLFSAIRTIKLSLAERLAIDSLHRRFIEAEDALRTREVHADRITALCQFLSGATTICLLYSGTLLVLKHSVSLGGLIAFYTMLCVFVASAEQVVLSAASVTDGIKGFRRLHDANETRTRDGDLAPRATTIDVPQLAEHLILNNVSFHYISTRPILQGCNLTIEAGDLVSVSGPSGVGKSTVASILGGLVTPKDGWVSYGDTKLTSLTTAELRARIFVVFQDTEIVDGTIAENITLGWPASTADIVASATQAEIHSFVESLPRGYSTRIGGAGVGLSTGQAQRIGLARAVLRNPPILILDEATSNLDLATEASILRNVLASRSGRTTVIVSHRTSVTALAPRHLYLHDHVFTENWPSKQAHANGAMNVKTPANTF
jgi:ATP-binding cassette subfamily B protein